MFWYQIFDEIKNTIFRKHEKVLIILKKTEILKLGFYEGWNVLTVNAKNAKN